MSKRQTRLPIVTPARDAVVIRPTSVPVFAGYDAVELVCGVCNAMISGGMAARGIRQIFNAQAQLIVRCPTCDAHNEIIDYQGSPDLPERAT